MKKISTKNKLLIIMTWKLILLIGYITLCYIYPQCIKDAFNYMIIMTLMGISQYFFLNSLRLTKENFIKMEGDEE